MYLLDSSAWLVHMFGEVGVEKINRIFDDEDVAVTISSLSIPEVYGRLRALNRERHWAELWPRYAELFSEILPVDLVVAERAIELRRAAPNRVPTIDALIAATAAVNGGTLVHRDPHMAEIPDNLVAQIRLPTG